MKAEFHPEALAEFESSALRYEEVQPGLGLRFHAEVESTLARILEAPGRWPTLEQEVRRCLTRVFPYAILFAVEESRILILAIMHCHRKPGYWRTRSKKDFEPPAMG